MEKSVSQRDVVEEELGEIQSVRRTQPANAGFDRMKGTTSQRMQSL